MNKARRDQLSMVIQKISNVMQALEIILYDEQEAYDNMPEGLKESERGINSMDAQESMESAMSALEEASACLEEIC